MQTGRAFGRLQSRSPWTPSQAPEIPRSWLLGGLCTSAGSSVVELGTDEDDVMNRKVRMQVVVGHTAADEPR